MFKSRPKQSFNAEIYLILRKQDFNFEFNFLELTLTCVNKIINLNFE